MIIRKLPFLVSSQISAGEIIFRPVSIVKELIENSLDADSTKIKIKIEQGGLKKIFVSDNGTGISKNELPIAIENHTTSKVFSLNDLKNIHTLGFRGEALSSISRVSRFKLTSRIFSQKAGWELYFENKILSIKPVAHGVGTSLEVLDLFYNIPPRRNFLKSQQIEFFHINKLIKNFALSRFDVSFTLYHNNNLICNYLAHKSKKKRLSQIFGKENIKNLLNVKNKNESFHIKGWVINPENLKNNIKKYLYINNRIVNNKIIDHAISRAYFKFNYDKKISYILYLKVKNQEIDINIHPTKHEILFYNTKKIYNFIYHSTLDSVFKKENLSFIKPKIKKVFLFKKFQSFSEKKNLINIENDSEPKFKKILTIFDKKVALVQGIKNNLFLISINYAHKILQEYKIEKQKKNIKMLLIPLKLKITDEEKKLISESSKILDKIGIKFDFQNQEIILRKLPSFFYKENIKKFFLDLMIFLKKNISISFSKKKFLLIQWLKKFLTKKKYSWDIKEATKILIELEKKFPEITRHANSNLFQEIHLNKLINILKN